MDSKMKTITSRLFWFVFVSFISMKVMAVVQVFPTRVVMGPRNKTQQVQVRNTAKERKRFRIKAVFYRQLPDGSLKLVDKATPEEKSAIDYLRFSPRSVTLEPLQDQTVRIQIKTNKLEKSDYRAHISFQEAAEKFDPTKLKKAEKGKMRMEVNARVSVAIPLVYDNPDIGYKLSLVDFKITPNKENKERPFFDIKVKKEGNGFALGQFKLYHKDKDSEEKKFIGEIRGISIYIPEVSFKHQISNPDDLNLNSGEFFLQFVETEDKKEKLVSETSYSL